MFWRFFLTAVLVCAASVTVRAQRSAPGEAAEPVKTNTESGRLIAALESLASGSSHSYRLDVESRTYRRPLTKKLGEKVNSVLARWNVGAFDATSVFEDFAFLDRFGRETVVSSRGYVHFGESGVSLWRKISTIYAEGDEVERSDPFLLQEDALYSPAEAIVVSRLHKMSGGKEVGEPVNLQATRWSEAEKSRGREYPNKQVEQLVVSLLGHPRVDLGLLSINRKLIWEVAGIEDLPQLTWIPSRSLNRHVSWKLSSADASHTLQLKVLGPNRAVLGATEWSLALGQDAHW